MTGRDELVTVLFAAGVAWAVFIVVGLILGGRL